MAKNLELNKICAAFLIFCVLVLGSSLLIDSFYKEDNEGNEKGYKIEVEESSVGQDANPDQNIDIFADWNFIDLLNNGDTEKGEKIFKAKCSSCHTNTQDGQNRVGPNLWGIVGRKVSGKSDYNYSKASQNYGGVWSEENLFKYLYKPSKFMPGTRMVFAGIKDQNQLGDLISYLNTLKN